MSEQDPIYDSIHLKRPGQWVALCDPDAPLFQDWRVNGIGWRTAVQIRDVTCPRCLNARKRGAPAKTVTNRAKRLRGRA